MTQAEKLDVASMFAADVERGRRVLALMEKRPLTVQDAHTARAYAERVWHGLERAPLSDAGGSRAPIVEEADEAARD